MKSIPKLIRRFVGIVMISLLLLILLNFIILAIAVSMQSPHGSPWDTANQAAADIQHANNEYSLSEKMLAKLKQQDVWAILIANDTHQIIWQTNTVPDTIQKQYTLSDIAELSRGYIANYPAFTGETENGLLVLGYPKDSFWKHTRASWDYKFISNAPLIALFVFGGNIVLIFLIYVIVNSRLLGSLKPITNGIQDLPTGKAVHIRETGLLSELAENINKSSELLQEQKVKLQKKDTARANWIAGVSHDIRTPLSMVMGYAGQLENSQSLSDIEYIKVKSIILQSERIKNLINDLNLASKLEYNMQLITQKPENVISVVRQVVVDFINMDINDNFLLEWQTDDSLSMCIINADKELLKRAVINLIQNSISHNKGGCTIYVSVEESQSNCIICIEDDGAGVSDEKIETLNIAPHYMVCDANVAEQSHGLGLLIVKQITVAHHGKMTVGHSKYGGFKVVLTLPDK